SPLPWRPCGRGVAPLRAFRWSRASRRTTRRDYVAITCSPPKTKPAASRLLGAAGFGELSKSSQTYPRLPYRRTHSQTHTTSVCPTESPRRIGSTRRRAPSVARSPGPTLHAGNLGLVHSCPRATRALGRTPLFGQRFEHFRRFVADDVL